MKILHTSDFHLGRTILEESLYLDQQYILEEILEIIKKEDIKVLLISGDIYDKSIPSIYATNLFNDFLTKLSLLNIITLIISGNHDSVERLGYGSKIFKKSNIHIITTYEGKIETLDIDDVRFYLLPFIKPVHLKPYMSSEEYAKITSSNKMIEWILKREKISQKKKNILLMHDYISNSDTDDLGTLEVINPCLFKDFSYVALGHIHKPLKIDTKIRYSGSPLKYSFKEVNDKKSVVIIDTDTLEEKLVPLKPLREMKILRGTLDEIMNMEASDDLIKVELLEEDYLLSPMETIRKRYKNALKLEYVSKIKNKDEQFQNKLSEDTLDINDLFKNFFTKQNDRKMTIEEEKVIKKLINEILSKDNN